MISFWLYCLIIIDVISDMNDIMIGAGVVDSIFFFLILSLRKWIQNANKYDKIAENNKIDNEITNVSMLVFGIPIAHLNASYLSIFQTVFTHICLSITVAACPKQTSNH